MTTSSTLGRCTDFGKFGQNAPNQLFYEVLKEAKKETLMSGKNSDNQKFNIDAVVITGDFIKSQFKAADNGGFNYKWAILREVLANTTKIIERTFPGVPVLPLIGDTDNIFYWHIPDTAAIKGQVYSDIGEVFFGSRSTIPPSFSEGGYYRKDLVGGKMTILALNSIAWNARNEMGIGPSRDSIKQLDWLERQLKDNAALKENDRRVFVLAMHIPPGLS